MGRTNPTFRDRIRRTQDQWNPYRRALRVQEQDAYDRLWEHASDHADAAGYLNPERTLDSVLFSICLAQEQRISELEDRLDDGD